MKKKKVISVLITVSTRENIVNYLAKLIEKKKPGYVCAVNTHCVIEAYENKEVRRAINNAEIALPDGKPICWYLKTVYGILQERITGPDLFEELLKLANNKKYTILLLGSTPENLKNLKRIIKQKYPNIRNIFYYSPPYQPLEKFQTENLIQVIKKYSPNLVFVSLGCPKQEVIMYRIYKKLNTVLIGIGAAFDMYLGNIKRPPKIIQELGLEWLYRLAQEPKRLFKRYLKNNSKFLILWLIYLIKYKIIWQKK